MPEQENARRQRLAAAMVSRDLSAVLVTDLINVRHLTGFTGSNGAVVVFADAGCSLATDSRYEIQAGKESPDVASVITRDCAAALIALAASQGHSTIGFEDESLTVHEFAELAAASNGELVPVGGLVSERRMVKDETELSYLRQACAATDQALEQVLPQLRPGVTERQIARWLDDALRDLTGADPAFETIVATGENSAIPHHTPTEQEVQRGDFLKIDFGGRVAGYHADMTRTVMIGREPSDWQSEIYAVVAQAQAAGRAALSATAAAADVDRAARSVVERAGFGDAFGHGLGHGVGLRIHEAPFLGRNSADRLTAAVPVTVEPGIYLAGRGGVRIEDTVVVHQDRVEVLTNTSRELLVLD